MVNVFLLRGHSGTLVLVLSSADNNTAQMICHLQSDISTPPRRESWILLWFKTQMRGINPVTNSFPVPEIIPDYRCLLLHYPFNHHAQLEGGGNEIRPHCAGGRETIRELWLTEVRLENRSFIHLSSSFFIHKTTKKYLLNRSSLPRLVDWYQRLCEQEQVSLSCESMTVSTLDAKESQHVLRYLTWRNYSCHLSSLKSRL